MSTNTSTVESLSDKIEENVQVRDISYVGLDIGYIEFTQLENKISDGVSVT